MAREAPIDSDPENNSDPDEYDAAALERPIAVQFQIILRRTQSLTYKMRDIEKELEAIRANQETLQYQLRQVQNSLVEISERLH